MAAATSELRGSEGAITPTPRGVTIPLLAVAAISATNGFGICIKIWLASTGTTNDDILRTANRKYSSDNLIVAGELANRFEVVAEEPAKALLKHFLIGAGKMREGTPITDPRVSRAAFHLAVEQLQIASAAWPAGREDEGDRMLGYSLFRIGKFRQASPRLESVINRNPTYRESLTPTLVRCLMRGTHADLQRALATIREYNMLPGRPIGLQTEAKLMEAECLIRLGKFQAAPELLASAASVSEAIARYGPGTLTNPKVRPEVSANLQPALETLMRLQRDSSPKMAQRTGIWIARAMRYIGNLGETLSQLNAVRLYQPLEGEGIAASLEQIECLVGQGSSNEAVQTARYLIREVGSESNFDASVVDLPAFRQRLQLVLAAMREQGETEACVRLARTLPPLFPLDQALYEEGLAFREAANRMEASLGKKLHIRDQSQHGTLRSLFAQAGNAFESSGRLRFESTDYTKTLWEAISALQKSGQFARSIPLLNDYLSYEQRIQHPRALLALGQAYLADNRPQDAIRPLEECMEEFPRDPLCYDARLQAAKAMAELDRIDEARQLLEVNLTDGELTPQSLTWKEDFLNAAIDTYRQIRNEIASIEDERQLRPSEQSMRQIGLLGEADTLYDLGLYEESADAYRTISLRYMNEPPALEAMLGQARCLRSLKKDRDARLIIRQAVAVLSRIPTAWDNRFVETTRYDRPGWESLLTWMDRDPLPPETDS